MSRRPLNEQFAAVRLRLDEQAREQAERRTREAAAAAREQRQRNQFQHAVGEVQPLRHEARHETRAAPPDAVPRQRLADEAQALASSLSDGVDSASLLDTDAELAYCRTGVGADVLARLRRGQWSIQRQLDLHGLTRDAAREALASFIRQATRDGLRCVRVVHGKGNGSPGRQPVLKGKVRHWLVQTSAVLAFVQARASDGGQGALLVLLG